MINNYDWIWYCDNYSCKNNNSKQEIYVCYVKENSILAKKGYKLIGLCKNHYQKYQYHEQLEINYIIEKKENN